MDYYTVLDFRKLEVLISKSIGDSRQLFGNMMSDSNVNFVKEKLMKSYASMKKTTFEMIKVMRDCEKCEVGYNKFNIFNRLM